MMSRTFILTEDTIVLGSPGVGPQFLGAVATAALNPAGGHAFQLNIGVSDKCRTRSKAQSKLTK